MGCIDFWHKPSDDRHSTYGFFMQVLLSSPSGVRNKPSSRSSSSNNVKKQSSGRSSSSTSRSHTFGSAEAKRADEAKRGAWQAEISSERRSIERSPSSTSPDEAKRVAWNSEIEKQRETRHAWVPLSPNRLLHASMHSFLVAGVCLERATRSHPFGSSRVSISRF